MKWRRVVLRLSAALLVLAGVDLLLGRFALGDGTFLGHPVAPFDPPLFSPSQFQALARLEADLAAGRGRTGKFDADLGWCNKPDSGFGEYRYDWAGARIGREPLAARRSPGVRRIVAVGCSMTHGEEVGALETWCAQLDELRDDVEVANLGVAAFGIDQALLRLRRDGWGLAPDEVWLGVLPQAALRVTTFFRPLLDHWSLDVAFKPRLRREPDGELSVLPNPARDVADEVYLLHDQRALLERLADGDPWISRAPLAYAPRGSSWTHRSFTARILLTLWERSGRSLQSCFSDDNEFGSLFTAIVRSMDRECHERGIVFRLLILPGQSDLEGRVDSGRGYWEDWADRLRSEGTKVFDLAPILGAESPFDSLFEPGGHYTPSASERVALALSRELSP